MSQDSEEVLSFRRRPTKIIYDTEEDSSPEMDADKVANHVTGGGATFVQTSPNSVDRGSWPLRDASGEPLTKRVAVSTGAVNTTTSRSSTAPKPQVALPRDRGLSTSVKQNSSGAPANSVKQNSSGAPANSVKQNSSGAPANSVSNINKSIKIKNDTVNGTNTIERQKVSVPVSSTTATTSAAKTSGGVQSRTNPRGKGRSSRPNASGRSAGTASTSVTSSSSSSSASSCGDDVPRARRRRRPSSNSSSSSGGDSSSSSGGDSSSSSGSSSDASSSDTGSTARASRAERQSPSPRSQPRPKKEASKGRRQSKAQQSSSDSDSDSGPSTRPPVDPKTDLISKVLSRWWYCLPEWPPLDYDYGVKLADLGLRRVELEDWEDLENINEDGVTKVYEVSHFPGVFRDPSGKAVDLRPTEDKPSFNEMNHRKVDDLQQLYVTALTNQLADLKNSPFVNTEEDWLKKSENKLKKMLTQAQRDLDKSHRRKEYLRSRGEE